MLALGEASTTLAPGTHLGRYEILLPLGAGGMGEVYKAADTRLNREVAIKILPEHLAQRPQLRERFEREARAVSSLNHPHICTLHDIGHHAGIDYLVLEYLEGETLAQRLKKGPLPLDQLLRYAIEIADGLDQAHRHAVVHRDLKPGNIMLTRSGAKVLDFGLAKLHTDDEAVAAGNLTALPTYTTPLTDAGTILGTFQYMAPEQLEGKEADARTDIFAFGAVVYEMATGRKAFEGKSQASLIAAILERDPPPISSLQPMTPPALDRVVRTCLAKDPDDRWQTARDLQRELKWIADPALQAESRAPLVRSVERNYRTAWAVAAVAVIAAVAVSWVHFREPAPDRPAVRFTIPTEAKLPSRVRISPDGTRLAFTGQNAAGQTVLWLRPLAGLTSQALPGTEGALYPFWSPDSRYIGFFDVLHGKLKKIDSAGGQPEIVCDAPYGAGGGWNPDGTILFSPDGNARTGIFRVSSKGGLPVAVTTPTPSQPNGHGYPSFFPDGRRFLYLVKPGTFTHAFKPTGIVYAASLDSKEAKQLVATSYGAVLSPGSKSPARAPYLLFVRNGALMAQEVDVSQSQVRGEPFLISDSLATDTPYSFGDFSVSNNGILAFNSAVYQHELIWLDRAGNRLGSGIPVDRYAHPTLAPDSGKAVFERSDPKTGYMNLWEFDTSSGALTLFESAGGLAVFSSDGRSVAFACEVEGGRGLCRKAAGGASRNETIEKSGELNAPTDLSTDGRFLAYTKSGLQLWILPLTGDRPAYRFYPTDFQQFHGQFSHDGKWMAYTSNETGDFEVYVQPFPRTGEIWKVSAHGGAQPRWRRDGKEMFYRTSDGKLMAVQVKAAPKFEPGIPRMLFQAGADPLYPNLGTGYAVTPDGQRFLINSAIDENRASPITIVMNWTAGLKR